EELAEAGLFGDIRHGYYLGGGSGVAEAYKLDGRILAADELEPRIRKAWQIRADDGRTFETHLSTSGINRDFGCDAEADEEGAPFPEVAAAAGDPRALELFRARASRLAEFCATRLIALHESRGLVLDRIVIGQRLGQLFLDPCLEACFARPAREALASRLLASAPPPVRESWVVQGELGRRRLMGSPLRAAAALGALALAVGSD
ncbi:MAG: hypothetical protein ABI054_12355, partial [Planctomycetota bacterium]